MRNPDESRARGGQFISRRKRAFRCRIIEQPNRRRSAVGERSFKREMRDDSQLLRFGCGRGGQILLDEFSEEVRLMPAVELGAKTEETHGERRERARIILSRTP